MTLNMMSQKRNGSLITLCGLDGSGKTTQIRLLKDYFESAGKKVFVTKQPTDFVRKNEMFRSYTDKQDHSGYDYRAVSLLCASDRVQHCNKVILPLLQEGYIVISDRYYYSCLANLIARGYPDDEWVYEIARHIPKPDAAFFLDVEVEEAVRRVRSRPEERERYIDMELQYELRKLYLLIAHENNGIIVNSGISEEQCFKLIKRYSEEVIGNV